MQDVPFAVEELLEGLKEAQKEINNFRKALERIDLSPNEQRYLQKRLAEALKRWKTLSNYIKELMEYFRAHREKQK